MNALDMKLLAEWSYDRAPLHRGYTRKYLVIDLGNGDGNYSHSVHDIDDAMIDTFTGGRGFGLKILWDAVTPQSRWDSPENALVISGGPICGITQYPGTGKTYTVFLSPLTEQTYNSNAGGYFGPYLKASGFDALAVKGKAPEDVVVSIDGDEGTIRVYAAPTDERNAYDVTEALHHAFATNEDDLASVSAVTAGRAAEHSYWGALNVSFYDPRRKAARLKQAGRGGGGTVLRDKGILALVVRKSGFTGIENDPADLAALQKVGTKLHREIRNNDDVQCLMRTTGTAHLNKIMNDYDILPVNNFKYGRSDAIGAITPEEYKKHFTQGYADGCWYGCSMACAKAVDGFELRTGPDKGKKVIVDGPEYETAASLGSNVGIFDPLWTIETNYYADHYALDTISLGTGLAFVCECYELGLITKEHTGGLDLRFGAGDQLMELIHRMMDGRDEFAAAVGKGIRKMKDIFAARYGADRKIMEQIGMEGQGLEVSQYRCQESVAQWGGYFLTLKGPQHDEAWVIFMDMVNRQLPTFEDKAEALFYFPNFRLWFSLVGVCKLPWNDVEPEDNRIRYKGIEAAKVPEHVQNYLDIYEAVTGKPLSKEDMILQSERVYNYERIFNYRMGKGTRKEHTIPDRALGPVFPDEWNVRKEYFEKKLEEAGISGEGLSVEEKISRLLEYRRGEWEKLVDAVYARRGWDRNGVPTKETVERLGLGSPEVLELLEPCWRSAGRA
ncbi:aldehyde:ferredoxin oxidoreductase [Aminivibrio pyruvatiphilus]|uniref:Aldehyde:ferredoxin oxidoreductase n=2 Tax=Aminivibrio pyruvatiphilus TaxID=1005740 RepID=A0A4R8LWX3_9BACT|nr:aldehyde ferredoxin oxidoreductase C-terminal domain-containing protein [Aminivibrio pyruvatiphilus]TDY51702.1 aldehyde:ferredoxin oxidoreductase [Aminivibrio pyruvatiphilus]